MTDSRTTGSEPELSARETEVLALLSQGMSNSEIAAELFIGIETVKTHLSTIYRKLGVERRGQAVAWAVAQRADAQGHGVAPATAETVCGPDGCRIVLAGELDITTTELLGSAVEEALAARPSAIRLDLGEVTFIDSGALRVLVALRAQHRDIDIAITEASPSVRRVLEYSKLLAVFGLPEPDASA